MNSFDALLVVSFGGPEKREDVLPFMENVLRGKNVPRERMLEVAEHYYHFDGRSPINEQNRELMAALEADFAANGLHTYLLGQSQLASLPAGHSKEDAG
jgi:ferrochelatase